MQGKYEKAGHPPKYNNVDDLDNAIQDYFDNGVTIKTVIVGRGNNTTELQVPVPTITGLCFHLGFESRQSFYDMDTLIALAIDLHRSNQ